MGQDNIRRQVEFIISVTSTIPFENVAVISYSTDAEIVIRPGQSSNFSEFADTLRQANYSMGHMKNLGVALGKAQEIPDIFNHTTPALVVAMILGKSDDDLGPYATELKQRGVTIVAMALVSSYNMGQLSLLTSNPLRDHLLTADVATLKGVISSTRDYICKGMVWTGSSSFPPKFRKWETDLIFVSRYFGKKIVSVFCEPQDLSVLASQTFYGSLSPKEKLHRAKVARNFILGFIEFSELEYSYFSWRGC